jgi:prepilin-type N-terminal cleavage/methylation domain-containing protein
MEKINNKNAFTLIEMSIVLAIIGLIAGTIATLGSIASNSKLIATIKELQNYKSAFSTFSTIYGSLPGDMDNATIIFGTTDVNGNTVYNGNGDGLIGDRSFEPWGSQEVPSAFQELALAGLINNQYSGVLVNNSCLTNVPYSVYGSGNIYWIYSQNLWSNYTNFNSLVLSSSQNWCYNVYTIAVNDAYNIDLKVDDGLPLTGLIIAYNTGSSGASPSSVNSCTTAWLRNVISPHSSASYTPSSGGYCTIHMSLETYGFE